MCELISWIEAKMSDNTVQVLFLTDKDVFSSYGRDKLKGCKDNDYLGHGAIRTYFDLNKSQATLKERENKEFWNKEGFPPEIAQYLESPKTFLNTWGKMVKTCLQPDDAYFVLTNAPKPWLSALSDIMVDRVTTDAYGSYCVLRNVKGLTEAQRDRLIDRVAIDAGLSCDTLCDVKGLTKIQKDKLVDRVATDARWSYYALRDVQGLTKAQKKKLEKASEYT